MTMIVSNSRTSTMTMTMIVSNSRIKIVGL